ncbi:MAG: hypothetical protein IJ689_03540 [Alphaproteobacteria bacterium]|nr:hypothetical protein [Alphaproteobacteria bacterium]
MTSKLWISGIGFMLALGYFMNCVVVPSGWHNARLIDWDSLNQSLLVLLAISGTRDITLEGIRLIGGKLSITNSKEYANLDDYSFFRILKRFWIPVVGWGVACGYFMNCVIWPLFKNVELVAWEPLATALLIMLVISGGREVTLDGVKLLGGKLSIKDPKPGDSSSSDDKSEDVDIRLLPEKT